VKYLEPFEIDRFRKFAGLHPAKFGTYYNLGGPEKHHAVGRIDQKDAFVIEMKREDYEALLQENENPREAYLALYEIYQRQ